MLTILITTSFKPSITFLTGSAFSPLLRNANANKIENKDRSGWISYADRMRDKYPLVSDDYRDKAFENSEDGTADTYLLLEMISDMMNADDIYVSGSSGSCIDISMQTFKVKKGQDRKSVV